MRKACFSEQCGTMFHNPSTLTLDPFEDTLSLSTVIIFLGSSVFFIGVMNKFIVNWFDQPFVLGNDNDGGTNEIVMR